MPIMHFILMFVTPKNIGLRPTFICTNRLQVDLTSVHAKLVIKIQITILVSYSPRTKRVEIGYDRSIIYSSSHTNNLPEKGFNDHKSLKCSSNF